ncbi:MAG: septum formation initiator family protein [Bacillaceae bacterium]|nr:septum formation initiator family protein [Bacillaceae bacterium]
MSLAKHNIREMNSRYKQEQEAANERQLRMRKGLYRRLTALVLFIVFFLTMTFFSFHSQNRVLGQKLEQKEYLEMKLEQLTLQERDLTEEIDKLNDLEYIAEIARRDYFLTKPGEIIFKLPTYSED